MRLSRLIAALAVAIPGLCVADPVTIVAVGAQALGAAGVISTAAAAWVGVAVAVYGAVNARRQQRRAAAQAREQQLASLTDRTYKPLTNVPPRVTVYGRVATGGYLVDSFASDLTAVDPGNGQVRTWADGLRHQVIVWASHECTQIHGLWIGSDYMPVSAFGADGWSQAGPLHSTTSELRQATLGVGSHTLPDPVVLVVSAGRAMGGESAPEVEYSISADGSVVTVTAGMLSLTYRAAVQTSMIRVSHHLGGADQSVDSYLHAIAPTRYTQDHRLRGMCYSVITYDLRFERWQQGPQAPAIDVSGKRVHDPRSGQLVYTETPALHLRDWLISTDGFGVDSADIDDSSVIAAANACEQAVSRTIGGNVVTVARFAGGGVVEAGARESTLDDLARAMAGTASYSGVWTISAGVYTAPVLDLTDDDLAGSISIVQTGTPDDQICNGMRGIYVAADALTATDYEPVQMPALVEADGGEVWASTDLPYSQSNAQCRHIARVLVEQRRAGLVISYPCKIHGIRLVPGDRVRVTSAEYGFAAKIFRVTDRQIQPRGVVGLTLQEDAPEVWDDVDQSAPDQTPNADLQPPWDLAPITGLTAYSGTDELQVAGDGTIITRVRVTWDALSAYADSVVVTWRPAAGGSVVTTRLDASERSTYLIGPADGETIVITAQPRSMWGHADLTVITHLVVGKSAPPPPVDMLALIELPGLGRQVVWTYAAPPLDLGGFEARYAAHSGTGPMPAWDSMQPLFEAGAGSRSYDATARPADGTWALAIRAVDTTGNFSAPIWTTATLSRGQLGTPTTSVDAGASGWPGIITNGAVDGPFIAFAAGVRWADIGAWSNWLTWDTLGTGATGIYRYQHPDIDTGKVQSVTVRTDAVSNGVITTEMQTSADGGEWSAWAAVPSDAVSTRWVRVRWTITGAAHPVLYSARVSVYTVAETTTGAVDDTRDKTTLHLKMDGADGSSTFIDTSPYQKTITPNGVKIKTNKSKFGGASGYFDGTNNCILQHSDASATDLSSGDFTISMWLWCDDTALRWVYDKMGASWPQIRITISPSEARLAAWNTSMSQVVAINYSSGTWGYGAAGRWIHVAATRSGNTIYFFVDGALLGYSAVSMPLMSASSNSAGIGGQYNNGSGNNYKGWMDDFFVKKGVALWTAAFTPPTAPLADQ